MKYKILSSIAVFAWPIAYAMEPEVHQFIPFESDQIEIINDLFEQIKDWEHPVLQHYEPDVLPESEEKFYTQESKITLSISDESTLGFEKKFCQLCSKWVLNYKRHIQQVHTKERPYKCNLCNNAFLYPCDLREHLEKHENNHIKSRPFKCTICNKAAYSAQKRLDNHMNTIHGEKGFICKWCNNNF